MYRLYKIIRQSLIEMSHHLDIEYAITKSDGIPPHCMSRF